MCLYVKKPTVVLPQLRVQLPEAAITSIPPLPSEPPPHRYRGGPKKPAKRPPSPRTATPSDGLLRSSPEKRRNAQAIVLSSLYKPSSAHLSFFSQSPKSTDERDRSVFKPPARPTASSMSSRTCNRDNRRNIPPWRGVSRLLVKKKIAAVTVVVCGSRRLALRLTAITSPSSGSIVAGRSRWCCSSSEGVEGWEEEWLNENGKRKKNEWTKNRGFFVAPLQLAMCIRQGPPLTAR